MAEPNNNQQAPDNRPILIMSGAPVTEALWGPLGEHYLLFFLNPQAAQSAVGAGVQAVSFNNLVSPDIQEIAANRTATLIANIVNGLPAIRRNVEAALGGLPLGEADTIENWLPGMMLHNLAPRLSALSALEFMVGQGAHIVGCVLHEDVTPDMRIAAGFCRARDIPVIHVPHANCHLQPGGGPDIHRECRSDYVAAAGPYMRDWFVANGFPAERIEVTGAPYFDRHYQSKPDRADARRIIQVPDGAKSVAFSGTWTQTTGLRGEWERELDEGLIAVLNLAKKWGAFLIKTIHPHDQPNAETQAAEAMRLAQVRGMVSRQHQNYMLTAADVLIAPGTSNMCIDAAILGTPSCYLQTEGFDYAHALPYRCKPDSLEAAAQAALDSAGDPAWDDFIATYNAAHPHGDAAGNVAEMVVRICQ